MSWRLTVRTGPRVRKSSHATLDDALGAVRSAFGAAPRRREVDLRYRTFTAAQQIACRAELKGPRRAARGGLDLRGDGTVRAWVGGLRRREIEELDSEGPYGALRRTLSSVSVEP